MSRGVLLAIALPCHQHRIRGLGDTAHRTPQLVYGVAPAQQSEIIRGHATLHLCAPSGSREWCKKPASRKRRATYVFTGVGAPDCAPALQEIR